MVGFAALVEDADERPLDGLDGDAVADLLLTERVAREVHTGRDLLLSVGDDDVVARLRTGAALELRLVIWLRARCATALSWAAEAVCGGRSAALSLAALRCCA